MPLRDHFRPPVAKVRSWDELHGLWPAMMVQHLYGVLPAGYVAGPTVHLGSSFEIDVSTYELGDSPPTPASESAPWAAPAPTLTLEADLGEYDEYEVRIYDADRDRRLVAAVEIVSPSNKDRPESRRAFATKCAALLHQDVSVSVVDVVTTRQSNLYAELLDLVGKSDPALGDDPPFLYAATLRNRKRARQRSLLDLWFYPLQVGQSLPALPLWLERDLNVKLDLDATYEQACRLLHLP
jgi:Protein of unknown function (DUF4058)